MLNSIGGAFLIGFTFILFLIILNKIDESVDKLIKEIDLEAHVINNKLLDINQDLDRMNKQIVELNNSADKKEVKKTDL